MEKVGCLNSWTPCRHGLWFVHSQFGEKVRPNLCMDKWNHPIPVHRWLSLTHANRTGTGPEYKDMEPGSILTVLCIPFMICPLRSADAKSGKVVQTFCIAGTIGRLDLSLSRQASEDTLRRPCKI